MKKKITGFVMFIVLALNFVLSFPAVVSAAETPTVKLQCTKYNSRTGEGTLKISLIDFYNVSENGLWLAVIRLRLKQSQFDTSIYAENKIDDNVNIGVIRDNNNNQAYYSNEYETLGILMGGRSIYDLEYSNNKHFATIKFKAKQKPSTIEVEYVDIVTLNKYNHESKAYGSISSYQPVNYSVSTVSGVKITYPGLENSETVGNEIVKKLDSALSNISLCDTTIKGPTYSWWKFEICPIKFDAKAILDFSKLSKNIIIDEKNKTVRVILGKANKDNQANIVQTTDMCDASWSQQYNDIKDIYKNANWQKFEKMKGELNRIQCDMFVSASMSCLGYLEFDYQNGYLKLKEGGILESASLSASFNHWFVPKCLCGTLSLTGSESGAIRAIVNENGNFTYKASLNPSLTAGAKISGDIIAAAAEGGISATLSVLLQTFDPKLTVKMSGDIYADARVTLWEIPRFYRQFLDYQLYPRTEAQAATLNVLSQDTYQDLYAKATPLSRDYLYNIGLCTLENEDAIYQLNGVYPDNKAQLVKLSSNSMMLVWNGDDGTKSDMNRTSLMYSIYEDGVWSEAKTLCGDKLATGDFKVVGNDDTIYIVYQMFNKEIDDGSTVDDALKSIDLYFMKYQNGVFGEPVCITGDKNEIYESIKDVKLINDTLKVVWIENSDNNVFMNTGKAYLKQMSLTDDIINTRDIKIVNCEAGEVFGDLHIGEDLCYYVEKNMNDNKSILHKYGTTDENMIESDCDLKNIQQVGNDLYYIKDAQIYKYDGEQETAFMDDVCAESFKIVENGDFISMVITVSNGFKNELYISNLTDGHWSEIERFTDLGKYIRDYSPFMYEDGTISVAVSAAEVSEEVEDGKKLYGNTSIMVLNQCEYFDIIASNLYYEEKEVQPNKNINLSFDVQNDSSQKLNELIVTIDNNGKNTVQKTIECNIEPYATKNINIDYLLPETITNSYINVEVRSTKEEKSYSNNNLSSEIGRCNVKINTVNCDVTAENSATLTASIFNDGYDIAKNVSIKLYDNNNNDELIHEVNIGDLKQNEQYDFHYDCSAQNFTSNDSGIINSIYMVVENDNKELKYSDNQEKITFKSYANSYDVKYEEVIDSMLTMNIEANNKSKGNIYCAFYNSDGSLNRCEIKSTDEINNNKISFEIKKEYGEYVRIFIWDDNMIPLCESQPELAI